ncbi:MAG: alpha-glucosidase [Firmicutes bacterium]|nr:alpha-glucosidase [Bacillota bacterium]
MFKFEKDWWKKAVIYQVYPRSFQDSNGDGIGDIQGLIRRLPYLEQLGIDCIWLSPVCRSPQDDNGYDISDYQDIDPMFGSLEDMDRLFGEARKRGIGILIDLVLNHSSDEHRWFQEARKSRENPCHDYYVWRDGVEGVYPNDMRSVFGGPAWQWEPGLKQYYLHQFSVKQPDLNWENPKLRRELYHMINWWLDRGAAGFRLDVIDQIAKDPELQVTCNGPRLHEFIRELSRETFQRGNYLTVGEAWGADVERAKLYSAPDGSEFSMVFQFEHMSLDQAPGKEKWDLAPLSLLRLKEVMEKWQTELYGKGWNSLFWDNHDLPRIVSRWGDDGGYREESAKLLALLLHGMQGTPFIYQGEELGMTNVSYELEDYRDIETVNLYRERREAGFSHDSVMESIHAKSRDNARTPMQWDDSENAGFTTGTPWMKVNPNYREINAAEQMARPDSVWSFYRQLIAFRKKYAVFSDGEFALLCREHPQIFAYTRECTEEKLLVICNFSGEKAEYPDPAQWRGMELLLSNYSDSGKKSSPEMLHPWEARMYYIRKASPQRR